jgi:hypothetical protein
MGGFLSSTKPYTILVIRDESVESTFPNLEKLLEEKFSNTKKRPVFVSQSPNPDLILVVGAAGGGRWENADTTAKDTRSKFPGKILWNFWPFFLGIDVVATLLRYGDRLVAERASPNEYPHSSIDGKVELLDFSYFSNIDRSTYYFVEGGNTVASFAALALYLNK